MIGKWSDVDHDVIRPPRTQWGPTGSAGCTDRTTEIIRKLYNMYAKLNRPSSNAIVPGLYLLVLVVTTINSSHLSY